jgi:hypothetical protein
MVTTDVSHLNQMRNAPIWTRLPFQPNARCTLITLVSHLRQRETCVMDVHLRFGAHALNILGPTRSLPALSKFQAPCSLFHLSPSLCPRHQCRSLPSLTPAQSMPPPRLHPGCNPPSSTPSPAELITIVDPPPPSEPASSLGLPGVAPMLCLDPLWMIQWCTIGLASVS